MNNRLIYLLIATLLVCSLNAVTVPTGALYYFYANTVEANVMAGNVQVLYTINAGAIQQYLASNVMNGPVPFNIVSGSLYSAWIEGNELNLAQNVLLKTTNNLGEWVFISPDSEWTADNNIAFAIFPTSTDEFSSTGSYGAAAELSNSLGGAPAYGYAGVDNGNIVFGLYQAFIGTTTPTPWTSFNTGTGSATINNGIKLGSTGTIGYVTPSTITGGYSGANAVLDAYMSITGTGGLAGIGQYTGNVFVAGGSVAPPGASICVAVKTAIPACASTVSSGFTSGTKYILSMVNNGMRVNGLNNYVNSIVLSTIDTGNSNVMVFAGGAAGNVVWVRARAYPSNGVMPTITYGPLTAPSNCLFSVSNTVFNFGTLTVGQSIATVNLIVVNDLGATSSNIFLSAGNWLGQLNTGTTPNNFFVTNTAWDWSIGTPYASANHFNLAITDSFVTLTASAPSMNLYIGLNLPNKIAPDSYSQTVNVINEC